MTPAGALTTQYSFSCSDDVCPDGANPYAGLVQAGNGRFYGMTGDGSFGTVFEITPQAELTTLYTFPGQSGEYPYSALIQATDE
jgi:uncharacterized repeat protein (TIGR03803 family)